MIDKNVIIALERDMALDLLSVIEKLHVQLGTINVMLVMLKDILKIVRHARKELLNPM